MTRKTIRETVGFLGVVASLLFVGLEIRQNTAVARGQARQELAGLNQEWLILLTDHVEFSDLWQRAWVDYQELDQQEVFRARMMMTLNLRRLENVFFQYQEGLVDESALRSYGLQNLGDRLATPRFNEWWIEENRRAGFHPDFVRFLEGGELAAGLDDT